MTYMGIELVLLSLEVLVPVPTLDNIRHREKKNEWREGRK